MKRLDKLVGTWNLVARTLDSKEDNIKGHVTIGWFLSSATGVIEMPDMNVESIELVGYDPSADNFPASVYGKIGSMPIVHLVN